MKKIVIAHWKMDSEEAILVDRLRDAADLFCESQDGWGGCPLNLERGACAMDKMVEILNEIALDPVNDEHFNKGMN